MPDDEPIYRQDGRTIIAENFDGLLHADDGGLMNSVTARPNNLLVRPGSDDAGAVRMNGMTVGGRYFNCERFNSGNKDSGGLLGQSHLARSFYLNGAEDADIGCNNNAISTA